MAEGIPAESLYTGAQALRSVPLRAKQELLEIFPELAHEASDHEFVRKVPPLKKQAELIKRHRKNKKPILEEATPVANLSRTPTPICAHG